MYDCAVGYAAPTAADYARSDLSTMTAVFCPAKGFGAGAGSESDYANVVLRGAHAVIVTANDGELEAGPVVCHRQMIRFRHHHHHGSVMLRWLLTYLSEHFAE